MNEKLFPSMKNIPSFDKEETAYLKRLLMSRLIELAREVTSGAIEEETVAQAILDKLKDQ